VSVLIKELEAVSPLLSTLSLSSISGFLARNRHVIVNSEAASKVLIMTAAIESVTFQLERAHEKRQQQRYS
jgi:hypothetical protein